MGLGCEGRKITQVKWKTYVKLRKEDGLEVKDPKLFNMTVENGSGNLG